MRDRDTVHWLVISVALSVALTVLLNVGVRVFPDAGRRVARRLARLTAPRTDNARAQDRRVRVFFPWKAMLLASIVLTVVANLVLWVTRAA